MSVLVAHFGDLAGAKQACGLCDFCAPANCVAQIFRAATGTERRIVGQVLAALRKMDGRSTGKLHSEFANNMDRDTFEQLLSAVARTGLFEIKESTFTAEGREIVFRKATLTDAGHEPGAGNDLDLLIRELPSKKTRKKTRGKDAAKHSQKNPAKAPDPREDALKKWRLAEAKQQGLPAFRIFSDKVLRAIVDAEPFDNDDLLRVPGISARMATRYGKAILKMIEQRS